MVDLQVLVMLRDGKGKQEKIKFYSGGRRLTTLKSINNKLFDEVSFFFLASIFIFFESCMAHPVKNTTISAKTAENEMTVDNSNESWQGDVTLNIVQTNKINDSITEYKVVSSYNNIPVGFLMTIKSSNGNVFVEKGLTFKSLRDTSNNFLQSLAKIYHVKTKLLHFKDSTTITYTDLNSMIKEHKGGIVTAQFKMFFETSDDEPELYLNIDENRRVIELKEKDSVYRQGILTALSK